MRGKIEEFSPLENISKTNLIFFLKKENIVGIHFDFILPETFFGHIIHSVNDPAVLTHSGKYQWINPIWPFDNPTHQRHKSSLKMIS